MSRKHWKHRHPRIGNKWVLLFMLVPFLLTGCASLEKASNWFEMASEVCSVIHKLKDECSDKGK